MKQIQHAPLEARESMPQGTLGIHAVATDRTGVYAVYLYEPNTNPVKAYEYRLRQGAITEIIEDLQIDRHAREAARIDEDFLGSFEELKHLIDAAVEAMNTREYMTFEDALTYVKTGKIRNSVIATLNNQQDPFAVFQAYSR